MKFGKRQIILSALMLSLGAAVYLNWQFTDPITIETTTEVEDVPSTEELGVAEMVNNSYIETVSDEILETVVVENEVSDDVLETISQARVERQSTRDEALDLLDDILEDVDSDTEAKVLAIEEASKIAQNMIDEANVENLIKAKGVDEVVVYISDDSCSVIVDVLGENSLIIQDIIVAQTNISPENITIIEAK